MNLLRDIPVGSLKPYHEFNLFEIIWLLAGLGFLIAGLIRIKIIEKKTAKEKAKEDESEEIIGI